jgi:hypothetical protein
LFCFVSFSLPVGSNPQHLGDFLCQGPFIQWVISRAYIHRAQNARLKPECPKPDWMRSMAASTLESFVNHTGPGSDS